MPSRNHAQAIRHFRAAVSCCETGTDRSVFYPKAQVQLALCYLNSSPPSYAASGTCLEPAIATLRTLDPQDGLHLTKKFAVASRSMRIAED